jgi:hypothetical protein
MTDHQLQRLIDELIQTKKEIVDKLEEVRCGLIDIEILVENNPRRLSDKELVFTNENRGEQSDYYKQAKSTKYRGWDTDHTLLEEQRQQYAVKCLQLIAFKESRERYRQEAERLWCLLDDIDTAEDMFKPEKNAHFKYVHKKHSARWDGPITSDGYVLSWKDDLTAQKEG